MTDEERRIGTMRRTIKEIKLIGALTNNSERTMFDKNICSKYKKYKCFEGRKGHECKNMDECIGYYESEGILYNY